MDKVTLAIAEFKDINPEAAQKALDIIAECDGGDEEEFDVTLSDKGYHMLDWTGYGPFNPTPAWIWDPEAHEWVSNDDVNALERYEDLEEKHHAP